MGSGKQMFKIVKCKKCSHIFTLVPGDVITSSLYTGGDYKVIDRRRSIFETILKSEYKKIIRRCEAHFSEKGSLLDFGCGKGLFLYVAKKRGWKVAGVETSSSRAKYGMETYGLDISTNEYRHEEGSIGHGLFNVITFFHVIEHIVNPGELLSALLDKNLLKNGLVIIEVPNINSLQSKMSKGNWMHLDVPRHISHFSEKSVDDLLTYLGLRAVRREYFSFHLGVLGMLQSLFTVFGYNRRLLFELKEKPSPFLLGMVVLFLPLAFVLEAAASIFKQGGILRIYAIKNKG
jgi:SAM-dependent methyltransferase